LVPSQKGLPDEVAGLDVVGLLQSVHLNAKSGYRDSGLVLLRQVELTLLLKTHASVELRKALNWGNCLVSCYVRRRCDGMGLGLVGCWSWELEDAEGET
jgi:hypothetical protein